MPHEKCSCVGVAGGEILMTLHGKRVIPYISLVDSGVMTQEVKLMLGQLRFPLLGLVATLPLIAWMLAAAEQPAANLPASWCSSCTAARAICRRKCRRNWRRTQGSSGGSAAAGLCTLEAR